ncbi:MAG: helix-turn-helix domain-containing protein [Treponema sp.]|jgi:AraC family transcriptional regulator|nr:helix-turn-helix domain-containing protein [Treponema sp.]
MYKPFDLFDNVLNEIEKGLKEDIDTAVLAKNFSLSSVHLRRLFKFAFGRTIGSYIRSRKLAASIEDLLNTDLNILDIALEYGLEHEQSYIRAFKCEFGLTPGELRKTGRILKITPPLRLFDSNRLGDCLIFGPDIVMIPEFHVIGKQSQVTFRDALTLVSQIIDQFIDNDVMYIPNVVNPNVGINICRKADNDVDYSLFMPSLQVKSLDTIPKGFDHYTFPSSLCARFHFIGANDSDLNMATADDMFKAIDDFMDDDNQQYFLERKRLNIGIFDSSFNNGNNRLWEWFAPVIKKSEVEISKTPLGIFQTYKQEIPALRFIGRKYTEPYNDSFYKKALNNFDDLHLNRLFDMIEKLSDKDPKTIYKGSDSYSILMKSNSSENNEYWIGMFMPKGTGVPAEYEMIDFPKSTLAVCSVYGKRGSIINYDVDCRKKLSDEGIGKRWFFQRFNWRTFFEEDYHGNRILEYCYFI